MPSTWPHRILTAAFAALTLTLAGCGGGGGSDDVPEPDPSAAAPTAPIARVLVAGDSLADVGTFGLKATVQNAADRAAGYPVFPELVARELGAGSLCNFFASADEGATFSTNAGCTNFAVGGAMVVNPVTRSGSDVPFAVEHQLEQALRATGGWQPGDLLLVDGGANDAAALAKAYFDQRVGGAEEEAIFTGFLAQQLDAGEIAEALARDDGEAVAARDYMQALARTWWRILRTAALDRGAPRVAVVDVPDISRTPRLRALAAQLESAEGPAAAAQFQADVRGWVQAFNEELARLAAGDPRVVVVPYYREFSGHLDSPSSFGLDNVTDAACPASGDLPDCIDTALDAAPPQPGLPAGWWRRWYFSDEFHPSPRGHELLAATVSRALAAAGWR